MKASHIKAQIRQSQKYMLQLKPISQPKSYIIKVYRLQDYSIQSYHSYRLTDLDDRLHNQNKNDQQNNHYQLQKWFDSLEQFVEYLSDHWHDPRVIEVSFELGVFVYVYIQREKNRNRYFRIGAIQLIQQKLNCQIELEHIIDMCQSARQLEISQTKLYINTLCKQLSKIQNNLKGSPKNNKIFSLKQIQEFYQLTLSLQGRVAKQKQILQIDFIKVQKYIFSQQQLKNKDINLLQKLLIIFQQKYENKKMNQKEQKQINCSKNKKIIQKLQKWTLQSNVNTQLYYFSQFQVNEMQITLKSNPCHYKPVMLAGRQRATKSNPIIKFSIRIVKMQQKISLGIVSQKQKNRIRCSFKHNVIKYCCNGTFYCLQAKVNAGAKFKEGDVVTIFANVYIGIIYWDVSGKVLYSQRNNIFNKSELVWIPYVQITKIGDTIEWIAQ